MAVFYNYIKGCGKNADNTGTFNSNNIWTFLKWSDSMRYSENNTKTLQDMRYAGNNPYLYFNSNSSYEVGFNKDLWTTGQIITSKARNQEMWYDIVFKNGPKSTVANTDASKKVETSIQQTDDFFEIESSAIRVADTTSNSNANYPITIRNFKIYTGFSYQVNFYDSLTVGYNKKTDSWEPTSMTPVLSVPTHAKRFEKAVEINNNLVVTSNTHTGYYSSQSPFMADIRGTLRIGADVVGAGVATAIFPSSNSSSDEIVFNKALAVNQYCKAHYFNATSDKRAKENMRKADFSATSIVTQTDIYSFTYKDSQSPSIGVIAQDVANIKIDDFSLVENKDATGVDGDFMSVKESKLIYILWKAIQEQQEEINTLKQKLKEGGQYEW